MVPCKSAQAFCRLGWIPKKVVVREALAVYVKGSGGQRRKSQPPEEPGGTYGPGHRLRSRIRRRFGSRSSGSLLQSEKGGLSGAGGHERQPGRGDIFHRLFRGL